MLKIFKLIVSIAIAEGAGIIGSIFTTPAIDGWYAGLGKPWFTPPAWVFAPVWTILFALMGVALYLVWETPASRPRKFIAVLIFFCQLALNVLWSYIFFHVQSPFEAFLEIIILWLAIALTIYVFAKISRKAAWLLVPYILWVSFAAVLNYNFIYTSMIINFLPNLPAPTL